MALALAIRDAGLPSCAGIMSPWVDLTVSMPSMLDEECCDYIPKPSESFIHKESQVEIEYKEKAAALTAKIKKQNIGPKIWHDSFDRPEGRIQMRLPPLLLVAGDSERLRDEAIYLAHRSAEPAKYKGPSYNAGKFEKSPFQAPTNTTLEVYEEMPHVFQMFDHPCTTKSYERTVEFINKVTNAINEPLPPSSFSCINTKGEFGPLKEYHKEIQKWENIGIVPSIKRELKIKTTRRSPSELLVYTVLLFAVFAYLSPINL
ncbi:unnamed protein product [Rhizophagus irregularis]|nr:unnamed protein product [Rhizophagus irregularis]